MGAQNRRGKIPISTADICSQIGIVGQLILSHRVRLRNRNQTEEKSHAKTQRRKGKANQNSRKKAQKAQKKDSTKQRRSLSGRCTSPEKTDTSEFVFLVDLCWFDKQKVKLRSRSQSGINGAPLRASPIYSVFSLERRSPSAEEGGCNFFFRKNGSFSGLKLDSY
jgi:hypothetical protein